MTINNSQVASTGVELATVTLTGGFDLIGTLLNNPAMIIFDNQSTVSIQLSTDGTNVWRTFPAGECLVLDMRAAQGKAPNFTFSIGTPFYAKGVAGAAVFSVSYIYAANV